MCQFSLLHDLGGCIFDRSQDASVVLSLDIEDLTRYAKAIRDGERATLPKLGHNEISMMGEAMDEMREALDGKEYVERYVQNLTHELKSPLSAIRGAAELLDEELFMGSRQGAGSAGDGRRNWFPKQHLTLPNVYRL